MAARCATTSPVSLAKRDVNRKTTRRRLLRRRGRAECGRTGVRGEEVTRRYHRAKRMVDMYYSECNLLSELRHLHIVQFLGICFLPDSQLPVLVMEELHCSLDDLLENTPDIPLHTKLSVLQDVARGLVFLHNRSPAVIHRVLLHDGKDRRPGQFPDSQSASRTTGPDHDPGYPR